MQRHELPDIPAGDVLMRDPFEKAIYRMASKRMATVDDYIRVAK